MRLLINKSNRWLPWLGLCVLGWFGFSTFLLSQAKVLDEMDWAHEAHLLVLQPDASRSEVRYLFIPFTPFGHRMIHELLRISPVNNSGNVVEVSSFFTRVAATRDILEHRAYLDYLLTGKVWLNHVAESLQQHLPSVFQPKNTDLVTTDMTHGTSTTVSADMTPLFTSGRLHQPDNTLVDTLRRLLQQARPGSLVRFSVFLFYYDNDNEPLLQDLLSAAERGVNVQLLVDLPESQFATQRTVGMAFKERFEQRLLEAASKGHSNSWIKTHKKISATSKNHTKIFLFSDSTQARDWTIITSENLDDHEREKYQAGFITHNENLYRQMNHYFEAMQTGTAFDLPPQRVAPGVTSTLFPQHHDDPVYRQLDNMRTDADDMKRGHLTLAMARWDHYRFGLAMKLVQLAEEGLPIELVMRNNDEIVDSEIQDVLKNRPNIHLHTIDVNEINIHSKYMLFEGFYKNSPQDEHPAFGKIVWTGSHNFTGAGLEDNYETWVEIHNDKLYDAYLNNFHQLEALVPQGNH